MYRLGGFLVFLVDGNKHPFQRNIFQFDQFVSRSVASSVYHIIIFLLSFSIQVSLVICYMTQSVIAASPSASCFPCFTNSLFGSENASSSVTLFSN